jgi:hypothetical protein
VALTRRGRSGNVRTVEQASPLGDGDGDHERLVRGERRARLRDLATAQDEFTVWFRAQLLDITGIDLSVPMDAPFPKVVFDWKA